MDIKENTKDEVIERNTEDDISSNDRSSWTKSLSKRGGKIMQRLLSRPRTNSMSSISQGEKETSPRVSNEIGDSGIKFENHISIDEQIEKFEKIIKATAKRNARIKELADTEVSYNEDLEKFKAYFDLSLKTKEKGFEIQMPNKLREGRHRITFSNADNIIDFHKKYLLPVIRDQRDAQYDAQKILNLFRSKSKDMKALYGRYSINFPMAGLIISQNEEFFRKLKELLNFQHKLSDLIMRPIQRLTQYQMLFQELMQACEEAEQPEESEIFGECVKIAKDISQAINAMVKAGRIEDFDGDINRQGELIMEEEAEVLCDRKPSMFWAKERQREKIQMFLFAQSVIVCHVRTRRASTGLDVKKYLFWHKFSINNMKVRDIARGGNELEFELHDTSHTDFGGLTIACETLEKKNFIVNKVTNEIRKLEFYKNSLVNPKLSWMADPEE